MTTSEIQKMILIEAGLKTSVKKYSTGSMAGYIRIIPIFQNGIYPYLPYDLVQKMKGQLCNFDYADKPFFCSVSDICIYQLVDDRLQMKKESKPKVVDINKVMKGWGSKNSQLRLDRASNRASKIPLWQKQS